MKIRRVAIARGLGQAIALAALTILFAVYYKQRRMAAPWITTNVAALLLLPALRLLLSATLQRWERSRCAAVLHLTGTAVAVLILAALGYVAGLSLEADNLPTLLLFYLLSVATAAQRPVAARGAGALWLSLLLVQGIVVMIVGNIQVLERNGFALSWSVAFYLVAALAALSSLFGDTRVRGYEGARIRPVQKLSSYLRTSTLPHPRTSVPPHLWTLPLLAIVPTFFLIDMPHNGGLGMSPQEYAFGMGAVGVVGMGIGLQLWIRTGARLAPLHAGLLHLAAATAPPAIFLLLSLELPRTLAVVSALLFVAQTATGLALGRLIHAADGEGACRIAQESNGHGRLPLRALLVAGCILLLIALSGWLLYELGYRRYFFVCTIASAAFALLALFCPKKVERLKG